LSSTPLVIALEAVLVLTQSMIPITHATTHNGSVCLSQSSPSCQGSIPAISGQRGSRIRVNVVVQGADSFDEFGVWVGANPNVIKAVSVDLVGSVLPDASTKLQCLNDCNSWLSGGPWAVAEEAKGQPTSNLTTGLLFSITYEVVGNSTSSTPINLYYTVSPSGWVTGRAYLHFTGGCDTMQCWFVPVQDATFHTSDLNPYQPLQTTLAGIFQSLTQSAITAVAISGALVLLTLAVLKRLRSKSGGKLAPDNSMGQRGISLVIG
jgi:hypothetical protein